MTNVDRRAGETRTSSGARTTVLEPNRTADGMDGQCAGGPGCSCQTNVADWYLRYAPHIRQFTLSHTGEPTVADDCTNETFLRALSHRHSFQCKDSGVRPWLFTIARNIVRDLHKSARCRYEVPTEVFPERRESEAGPEQIILRHEATSDLDALLEQLPRDQATCLRLRFFEQLTVRETADVMNRDERAIRSLQHRAIRKLAPLVTDAHLAREVR